MIGKLKPYLAYKDSGIPWLGRVPAHWHVLRAKRLFSCIDIRSSTGKEELLTVSAEHGVIPRASATVTMFKAESYIGHKLCWPGDLVANSLWAWSRGIGVSRHHGIVSSAYGVYRLRNPFRQYTAFVHNLMRSSPFNWELTVRSKGIWISRLQLTDEVFLGAPIPVPSGKEQSAIVQFLNYIDAILDRYIHAKQNQIKFLKEKKQAIIQRTVNCGLNPNARFKSSGIDCLGKVPMHWKLRRIGQIGRFFKSTGGGKEDEVSTGVPCVHYGDLYTTYDYHISKARSFIRTEIARNYTLIKFGDILFATSGETIDEIGKSAVNLMQGEVRCGGDVILFRPKCQVDARFMGYSTDSRLARIQKATMGRGITIMHIYAHQLKRLAIAIPPLAEQTAIASFLDQRTAEIDAAISATQRQISLLREFHTRLIADVVTGKLDVREAAAQLPKQLSEPESVDATHSPPHMPTGIDRDPDASTQECEP